MPIGWTDAWSDDRVEGDDPSQDKVVAEWTRLEVSWRLRSYKDRHGVEQLRAQANMGGEWFDEPAPSNLCGHILDLMIRDSIHFPGPEPSPRDPTPKTDPPLDAMKLILDEVKRRRAEGHRTLSVVCGEKVLGTIDLVTGKSDWWCT